MSGDERGKIGRGIISPVAGKIKTARRAVFVSFGVIFENPTLMALGAFIARASPKGGFDRSCWVAFFGWIAENERLVFIHW